MAKVEVERDRCTQMGTSTPMFLLCLALSSLSMNDQWWMEDMNVLGLHKARKASKRVGGLGYKLK